MNKKYLSILLLATTTILGAGCKKFIDETPRNDQANPDSDPNLATNLVTGVYATLMTGDTWGDGDIHGFSFIAATNIMSDDADKGSSPGDQPGIGEFDNFTITPTSVFANSLWKGHYYGIGQCNQALAALDNSSLDATTLNQFRGEVRFIRAYYYFNLVRMFGGVPPVVRVPADAQDANSDPSFNTRASVDDIYNNVIIPDLEFATANTAPLAAVGGGNGRVTQGAAQTLLAKVYMYRKNWEQVETLTAAVIASGKYQLDDYQNLWRPAGNNGKESVFEVQSGVLGNTDLGINNYCTTQGARVGPSGGWTDLGWGFCVPSSSLIGAYEAGDLRRDATVITIVQSAPFTGTTLWDGFRIPSADSVSNDYYNYKAYSSELATANPLYKGNRDQKQKNIHLLRYAEVLLMHAEAANELGMSGVALDDLNAIRERAGLEDVSAAAGEPLRMAIWNERRVELALEHDRFWDLVRQGRAATVMSAAGKAFTSGKNELLPIPSVQIALSGNRLTQNNGY